MATSLEREQQELADDICAGSSRGPQGCRQRLPPAAMLADLDDDRRLTREQIGKWLTQESRG